jgi:putative ABC transport system substrate-binding protein
MKALVVYILLLLVVLASAVRGHAADIAVLMSSNASVYQEALEGFRESTQHRIMGVQTLNDNPSAWREELRKLRSIIEPDLIFVIGTSALQAVAGDITNIPVVHAMVFNPFAVANSSSKNIAGISMIPAVNQSIALIKELNPKYRRVGVIYDPIRTGALFFQARSVAQKENIQLIAREIRSSGEIAGALKSLEKEIDALWLWPDEAYLGDEILERIFLFSFERKIPVLGLSERHTQMGAVMALSYGTARDTGRQAGEAANRLLGETKVATVLPVSPRQTKLTINLKTARKLGVDLPDSIIQRADNTVRAPVYKEGDWWSFAVKIIDPNGSITRESHIIKFTNGAFISDHPRLLTGEDKPGIVRFLTFASVYITDPRRKWLDFPLSTGKTWSFTYRAARVSLTQPMPSANAEVMGARVVDTMAGKFQTIEIHRTDHSTSNRYQTSTAHLVYFYSPEAKSVVKLRAETSGSYEPKYELELEAYGNEATNEKVSRDSSVGK